MKLVRTHTSPLEEIERLKEELCDEEECEGPFLGAGQKGLYCARVGGIPTSSGCRIDAKCSKDSLSSTKLAWEHISVSPEGYVMDVRCGLQIGERLEGGVFRVSPSQMALPRF